jgi:hypothetical protein
MSFVTLDPTSGSPDTTPGADPRRRLAPRPVTLAGQRVGLVANGLGCGEALLAAIYEELAATDALEGTVPVVKGSVSIPPDAGDWARLTEGATVAITGFGG